MNFSLNRAYEVGSICGGFSSRDRISESDSFTCGGNSEQRE